MSATWWQNAADDVLAAGYVRVPNLVDCQIVRQLRMDIDEHAAVKSSASADRTLVDGYPRLASVSAVVDDPAINHFARAVCGDGARLQLVKGAVRAAGEGELGVHTDTGAHVSSPFRRAGLFLTVQVICEPFHKNAGATFFVPNSHRLLRDPRVEEVAAVPRVWVDAEPGDLVCWLGETWHGRFQRQISGARISLFVMYAAADLRGP